MLLRGGDGVVRNVTTPAWLIKVLAVNPFRGQLGPEDNISIDFANRLRAWAMEGQLNCTFTHIPHEIGGRGKSAIVRLALAKALGLIPGSADFVFVGPNGGGWIELKTPENSLSMAQKGFRDWCSLRGVRYAMCRSADEAEEVLRQWGLLE